MTSPLSAQILQDAFDATVSEKEFTEKIKWWLISPHAAERWFQFEFAYRLNRKYDGQYLAACEVAYTDIAVFDAPGKSPLWENRPVAKIELKMIGNWCVYYHQLDGIEADMQKVEDETTLPSVAITFCTVFGAQSDEALYEELVKQISRCKTTTFDDVKQKLRERLRTSKLLPSRREICVMHPFIIAPAECPRPFTFLQFHLLAHPNLAAETEFKKCEVIGVN